jgi:hypothetical protein
MSTNAVVPENALPLIAQAMGVECRVIFELEGQGNEPSVADASVSILDENGVTIIKIDLNTKYGPTSFAQTIQLAKEEIASLGGSFEADDDDDNPLTSSLNW